MTEREEIDMLRRAVADLTERVRTLEARPSWPVYGVPDLGPVIPYPSPVMPHPAPWSPPVTAPWTPIPPVTCGDPMPMQPMTTCVAQQDRTQESHWLAHSRGEA